MTTIAHDFNRCVFSFLWSIDIDAYRAHSLGRLQSLGSMICRLVLDAFWQPLMIFVRSFNGVQSPLVSNVSICDSRPDQQAIDIFVKYQWKEMKIKSAP